MASAAFSALVLASLLLSASSAGNDDPRIKDLLRLQKKSLDSTVSLSDSNYGELVKSPRPYTLVIFFDAQHLYSKKELGLEALRKDYGVLASTHNKEHQKKESAKNLFFCVAKYDNGQDVFRHFRLETLPHITVLPAGKASKDQPIDAETVRGGPNSIASYLSTQTGQSMGSVEKPGLVSKQVFTGLVIGILLALPFAARFLLTVHTPLHEGWLWCLAGLVIYFFATSGGLYNIIRGMPMYMMNREGKWDYFYHGSGAQLGVEGFTAGALYSSVGLLMAFATHVVPRFNSVPVKRALVVGCMAACCYAVRQLVMLDHWKVGYWAHAYYPKWLR